MIICSSARTIRTAIRRAKTSSSMRINMREDMSPQLKQKILYDNPRAFYVLK